MEKDKTVCEKGIEYGKQLTDFMAENIPPKYHLVVLGGVMSGMVCELFKSDPETRKKIAQEFSRALEEG